MGTPVSVTFIGTLEMGDPASIHAVSWNVFAASFRATVVSVEDGRIQVERDENEAMAKSTDRIEFSTGGRENDPVQVNDHVNVYFTAGSEDDLPDSINVTGYWVVSQ